MPNATRFRNHPIREHRHHAPSRTAIALASLTVEQVLYEIELISDAQWTLGQRRGHSWYNENGGHLAEAAQIKAIRIPARRH